MSTIPKRSDKSKKIVSAYKKDSTANKVQMETIDHSYFQINKLSFSQNFKHLIGHYKMKKTNPRS